MRILAWAGESVFLDFLLTALTQKHESERLLMSEYAKIRSWPFSVCYDNLLLTR